MIHLHAESVNGWVAVDDHFNSAVTFSLIIDDKLTQSVWMALRASPTVMEK